MLGIIGIWTRKTGIARFMGRSLSKGKFFHSKQLKQWSILSPAELNCSDALLEAAELLFSFCPQKVAQRSLGEVF